MNQFAATENFNVAYRHIRNKPGLNFFYRETYRKFKQCLDSCPPDGAALEIGSGAGFTKEVIPSVITSELFPAPGVDRVVDATQLDFPDASLRAIFLLNVLHHIPTVENFFREAQRCLVPGGRIFIVDHFPGWVGRPVYRYLHSEAFTPEATTWEFSAAEAAGGANAALAWIVFERDIARFTRDFPNLQVVRYQPHTPFLYWLSGGLKSWDLVGPWLLPVVTRIDAWLSRFLPRSCSFVDIELVKQTAVL